MKTINLTPKEYITNFRKIAKFAFFAEVLRGEVVVTANTIELGYLGF